MKSIFTSAFCALAASTASIGVYACAVPAGAIGLGNPCKQQSQAVQLQAPQTIGEPSASPSATDPVKERAQAAQPQTAAPSPSATDSEYSAVLANTPAKERSPSRSTPTANAVSVEASAKAIDAAPAAPTTPERLIIQAGQRLSVALGAWLKGQSIELSWEPAGSLPGRLRDVVFDSTWFAKQVDLEPTLQEVLAPFGLAANFVRPGFTESSASNTPPTTVVVRNSSNARP